MRFSDTLERPAPRDTRAPNRVLIVDDDPGVLATLTSVMHGAGYEVTPTSNLREALQTLGSERFHLVLTDLYLGDQDLGYRVAEVAHSQNPPVPVVLLTAKPSFDNAAAALRSRVSEMVVKPVDPHTLLSTCRRTIHEAQLSHRNRQLEAQNRVLAAVLPRAIEIKDPTTSGHADRVVGYAESLARRCSIGQEDREHLRLAALLHDVGKIGVPDTILTKPGALTPDEREIINRHPKMGFDILEPLQHHEKVRLWVYQHHERWDGKGYPEGLAGEDVALPGRILILAEVYDALAETRSYKPAWEIPKIVALFRDQAGRHFDPELAKLVADGLERMGSRFFAADPGSLF